VTPTEQARVFHSAVARVVDAYEVMLEGMATENAALKAKVAQQAQEIEKLRAGKEQDT